MGQDFQYDVFLSHSAKDKAVVRTLAERLGKHDLSPCVSGILHSSFCILPFPKGSLAQFVYINWLPTDREQKGLKARKEIAQGKRSETSTALANLEQSNGNHA
jgi:hypothetical protein